MLRTTHITMKISGQLYVNKFLLLTEKYIKKSMNHVCCKGTSA